MGGFPDNMLGDDRTPSAVRTVFGVTPPSAKAV